MRKLLSITIPTYNRCKDINKNLELLCGIIDKDNLSNEIQIVISDNASPDNTEQIVRTFAEKGYITYFRQSSNIGGESNMLKAMELSDSDYVMLMGDDDFFSEPYLIEVLTLLKNNPNVNFIAGNFRLLYPDGSLGSFREKESPTRYYTKGLKSCWALASLAHQLSGLVFRKEGLVEYYKEIQGKTLYTQIIFAALLTLHGDAYHITKNPILVSHIPQNKKDWSYGKDGLFLELLGCVKGMKESYFVRSLVQCSILANLVGPTLSSVYQSSRTRYNFIKTIVFSRETTLVAKLYFPILLFQLALGKLFKMMKHNFNNNRQNEFAE